MCLLIVSSTAIYHVLQMCPCKTIIVTAFDLFNMPAKYLLTWNFLYKLYCIICKIKQILFVWNRVLKQVLVRSQPTKHTRAHTHKQSIKHPECRKWMLKSRVSWSVACEYLHRFTDRSNVLARRSNKTVFQYSLGYRRRASSSHERLC